MIAEVPSCHEACSTLQWCKNEEKAMKEVVAMMFATLIGTDNVVESREYYNLETCVGWAQIFNDAYVGYYGPEGGFNYYHVGDLTFHCEEVKHD